MAHDEVTRFSSLEEKAESLSVYVTKAFMAQVAFRGLR